MRIFLLIATIAIFTCACNSGSSHTSTEDSTYHTSAPANDTSRINDTASYDRMPNKATGTDSSRSK